MHKGEPVTIELKCRINPDARNRIVMSYRNNPTGSYSAIFVNPRDYVDTLSVTTFPVLYNSMLSYSGTFQITLPEADTIYCLIRIECAGWHQYHPCYFVSSEDTMMYLQQFTMPLPPNPHVMLALSGASDIRPDRDTLTNAQLATKFEIQVDLRDKDLYSYAEKVLGPIPESCKSDLCDACYILNVSLGNIYKLHDAGVNLEFTTPPPWDRRYDAPVDSVLKNEP
jgi:hypothetical protein